MKSVSTYFLPSSTAFHRRDIILEIYSTATIAQQVYLLPVLLYILPDMLVPP
jgi:hypothetical protein